MVVYDFFKLPKGHVVSRYTAAMAHFLITGFLHAGIDIASGIPWHSSGAIRFFCTQLVGIVVEEGVQVLYFSLFGATNICCSPSWNRCLRYIWVTVFLS